MTFEFKIQLLEVKAPQVWRCVRVPGKFSFEKMHKVMQALFGWDGYHLYEFSPGGIGSQPVITSPNSMMEEEYINCKKYRLDQYFSAKGDRIIYTYDFGDSWEHEIKVEKVLSEAVSHAVCLGAQGAPPPDDCGGVMGFEDFKATVNNPKHKEYEEIREWAGLSKGKKWDVHAVDLDVITARLEKI